MLLENGVDKVKWGVVAADMTRRHFFPPCSILWYGTVWSEVKVLTGAKVLQKA